MSGEHEQMGTSVPNFSATTGYPVAWPGRVDRSDTGQFDALLTPNDPVLSMHRLRSCVRTMTDRISALPEWDWQHDEALWRLEDFDDELSRPRPSKPRAQSRWIRLAPLLEELLPSMPISSITELVEDVFRRG